MEDVMAQAGTSHFGHEHIAADAYRRIPIFALGMGLSLFFVVSYVLCVLGYLLIPGLPVEHWALSIFLPGFTLLSFPSFLLGLFESFAWGWYIALVFAPIYNYFAGRAAAQ
jgi:2TM family of unknown function (DUF5676)